MHACIGNYISICMSYEALHWVHGIVKQGIKLYYIPTARIISGLYITIYRLCDQDKKPSR